MPRRGYLAVYCSTASGQIVMFHQWAPGVRSGTTWLVVECGLPPHFTALVERKKEMTMQETISAGDAGFEEPVIRFEEPEVKEAGDLKTVTKGFFGSFSPSPAATR